MRNGVPTFTESVRLSALIAFVEDEPREAANRLLMLENALRDMVQLSEEQSGRLPPEQCKFSALACIDGVHVAECPVSVARTLLDRPSAGAAEG